MQCEAAMMAGLVYQQLLLQVAYVLCLQCVAYPQAQLTLKSRSTTALCAVHLPSPQSSPKTIPGPAAHIKLWVSPQTHLCLMPL